MIVYAFRSRQSSSSHNVHVGQEFFALKSVFPSAVRFCLNRALSVKNNKTVNVSRIIGEERSYHDSRSTLRAVIRGSQWPKTQGNRLSY